MAASSRFDRPVSPFRLGRWRLGAGLAVSLLLATVLPMPARGASPSSVPMQAGAKRDPLAVAAEVDRLISSKLAENKVPVSPLADDAEFCRRAHLDIIGRIPSAQRAQAFIDSKEPDKRRKLVDELLARPEYGKFFGALWHDLIVPEKLSQIGPRPPSPEPFRNWLAGEFNKGRPWSAMVTDMLASEGSLEEKPQQWFLLSHRDMKKTNAARIMDTTVQLFMGLQLHCAECHAHPYIPEWKQEDFWGMAAFFGRVGAARGEEGLSFYYNRAGSEGMVEPYNEKGDRPRFNLKRNPELKDFLPLPNATLMINTDTARKYGTIVKAKFLEGETPDLSSIGDKGPYRPVFTAWLTSPKNKYFARAAVNRWWAHFFGRGLVNPINDMHDGNSATHPELLQTLADEFATSGFDIKHLIRGLCNSQAYQRTSQLLPGNRDDGQLYSHMAMKLLSPEQLDNSLTDLGILGKKNDFRQIFTDRNIEDPTVLAYGTPQFLLLLNSGVASRPVRADSAPEKIVEEMYLTMLGRRPTGAEIKRISDRAAKSSPSQAYKELSAALLNCAEFLHNH